MPFKRARLIGKLGARRLWVGLAAICALLAGSGVVASPAYAATVGKEHVCKVIGDDNPNNGSPYHEAVVCTDLLQYDEVWAAAGTPNTVFSISPADLVRISQGHVEDVT